ncbi:MAG: ATP-dependent helicase/nuclease subunit A, partial [Kiritimatiellia bacterium]
MSHTQPSTQQPTDQAARQRALDTTASFAVSAPAGSGKTGLLSQRVLALLAQCDEPENVLAITFTKKAAAEMQSRILTALRDTQAQPTEPEEAYKKITWHLARAVLARNEEKQWQLFSCPNRLRITTIDSFCRSLSQQMPFESKLGNTPEILDNVDTAYQLAARDTLKLLDKTNPLQDHLRLLVKHFDNRLDQIETLFSKLLSKRDQWLTLLLHSKDKREFLETMLTEVIEEQLHLTQAALQPISSELALLADHAASNLQDSSSAIKACAGLIGLPNTSPASIPQWQGLAELLLTKQGDIRKSASASIGFLAPSTKGLDPEQKASAKAYKTRISDLYAHCKSSPELEETIRRSLLQAATLPDAHYPEAQWQLLDSLSHILVRLVQNLTLAFQQLGKTDYLAVTLAALDALGEPDAPTDLALSLDYRIQHILIDEFQDTSTTQLELLQRLTAGWQDDDGRTLFVVGDAMQSCYGFRNANVGIFLDVRENGVNDIALEPLDLSVNFRSQQGIVEWVNQSFAHIFPAENNSNRGAVRYKPSVAFNADLGIAAVQTYLLCHERLNEQDQPTGRSNEAEANIALGIIQQNQAQNPSDRIAILVRSKKHSQAIIAALSSANIAYQATEIDRLDTCMPVIDLLSLSKALLYPNDRLAWLSLLRAPWCGLDMDDLLRMSSYVDPSKADTKASSKNTLLRPLLLHSLNNPQAIAQLSDAGQYKITRMMGVINPALAQQQRLS